MKQELYALLNREQSKDIVLRGQSLVLRLLSARELLELEWGQEETENAFAAALYSNAALVGKSLQTPEGEAVFQNAEEVLNALSAEEICNLVETYENWTDRIDPSFACDETRLDALKKA